ncbi:MAG: restriction endonuclease [Ignavibacteria bacterium]|nr:restriction endonuclease [Ignavibacteria bacterium]
MPIIDFTEIPPANSSDGKQDTFELFARDFLAALGFDVEENPSRGADGGKDLIVLESLSGLIRDDKRKWVVSCKHYIHSGKSVGDKDEIDVMGRVRKFKANGFMAFYSTVPSSGLTQTFNTHKDEAVIAIWDNEKIESALIVEPKLQVIFERYFPKSYKEWRSENKKPVQVFGAYSPLECVVCGEDLLTDRQGNISLVLKADDKKNSNHISDVYWACTTKKCDAIMEGKLLTDLSVITTWISISELATPLMYMRWVGSHLTLLHEGKEKFEDRAFEKFRNAVMCVSQIVVKETTPAQWSMLRFAATLPDFLGGIGSSGTKD